MNVLVVIADSAARTRISQVLEQGGHSVVAATRLDANNCSIELIDVEVAIIDFVPGARAMTVWMRALRAEEYRHHIYVLALVDMMSASAIEEAWAWGADDMTRATALPAELLGRVQGPARIGHWSLGNAGSGHGFRLDQLHGWRELETLSASAVAGLLGTSLTVAECPAPERFAHAAEVRLCLPRAQTEVVITLWLSQPSALHFGNKVFAGLSGRGDVQDALREAANAAAGAFRRAANDEGIIFTSVLPSDLRRPDPDWAGGRNWVARQGALEVGFVAVQRKLKRARAFSGDLREGMVLATDLHNQTGMTLASAGTVLTERTAQRIIDLVGTIALVEIVAMSDAA